MEIQLGIILIAAMAVIGVLEWAKALAGFLFKAPAPSWVWHLLLLPVCILCGLLTDGYLGMRLLSVGVLLLFVQVGYQIVIQGAIGLIKALVASIQRRTAAVPPAPTPTG